MVCVKPLAALRAVTANFWEFTSTGWAGFHGDPCVGYTEPRRFASRVLKKPASSVLNIREAYLVKRRSFRTRMFHASRFTSDEDGLSSTLRAVLPCCPRCKRERGVVDQKL